MKFGMVNKLTTVNIFVLHTLHRTITHRTTRKTNIKIDILKGGVVEKSRHEICLLLSGVIVPTIENGKELCIQV